MDSLQIERIAKAAKPGSSRALGREFMADSWRFHGCFSPSQKSIEEAAKRLRNRPQKVKNSLFPAVFTRLH